MFRFTPAFLGASRFPLPAAVAAPDAIDVYFDRVTPALRPGNLAELDHAARLYRDGKPILMTAAAGTDPVGSPETNMRLSQLRADAVFLGLVARGTPQNASRLSPRAPQIPPFQTIRNPRKIGARR